MVSSIEDRFKGVFQSTMTLTRLMSPLGWWHLKPSNLHCVSLSLSPPAFSSLTHICLYYQCCNLVDKACHKGFPLLLSHIPKNDLVQLWWCAVQQQSRHAWNMTCANTIKSALNSVGGPSKAVDSTGWGNYVQHNICWGLFALSADS